MSDINILQKKIYKNKPEDDSNGQYNFGRVGTGDSLRIMGKQRSGTSGIESDLYSTVYSQPNYNLESYPDGLLNGIGSKLRISYANVEQDNQESDGGRYTGVKFAFYVYDGNTIKGKEIAEATSGTAIRAAIGTGDSFEQTEDGSSS